MTNRLRTVYVIGNVLGLIGCLVTVVSLLLVGRETYGMLPQMFVATFVFVISLRNTFEREDFDRDHGLGYRIGNAVRGLLVVAVGAVMIGIGILSFTWFG